MPQLCSQALRFLHLLRELDDFALLLPVQVEEELEGDGDVSAATPAVVIVVGVDYLLQLLVVGVVFAQLCACCFSLQPELRDALSLRLRLGCGLVDSVPERVGL